ncbi:unnamed protein product [Fusarium venenatum]|uniref:Chromo domain-containing protein n=1 Tax=Fusarium venenatum TaxID=56646 RepID=A0A2L2T972_9HYPO|nr:uncharacterized protein FVRRES_06237 [Fusarium venenatum]CEI61801.1 unnamed protein product [Fusarium venenatum]
MVCFFLSLPCSSLDYEPYTESHYISNRTIVIVTSMCTSYDPRIYDVLSCWSFDPAKDVPTSSSPQHQPLISGATALPGDLSQHSEGIETGNNHTYRRYSSVVNGLPIFDNNCPDENARTILSSSNPNKPPTTDQVTSYNASSLGWPSPPVTLEVFRVIGYRTIFGRGYDEKNEFWVNWKGYPASEGTWMKESLVRRIAPLQVAEFNRERRLYLSFDMSLVTAAVDKELRPNLGHGCLAFAILRYS